MLLGSETEILPEILGPKCGGRRGRLLSRGRGLIWGGVGLWISGREHENYANDHSVTTFVILASSLLFGVATREAARKIHDLSKGRENLNLCNVRLPRVFRDLLHVRIQESRGSCVIALAQYESFVKRRGSERNLVSEGNAAVRDAEQHGKEQARDAKSGVETHESFLQLRCTAFINRELDERLKVVL